MIEVKITSRQNDMLFDRIKDHTCALKNWIASAVESDDLERAKILVKELRQYQELYIKFNPIRFDKV